MSLYGRISQRKAALSRAYRDRADVYKATYSSGSYGQGTATYPSTPSISQAKCALQGLWGQERKLQNRVAEQGTYILYMEPQSQPINAGDRLKIDNVWYEIEVCDMESFKDIYWEIHCLLVV
jgi:hypothetical protein